MIRRQTAAMTPRRAQGLVAMSIPLAALLGAFAGRGAASFGLFGSVGATWTPESVVLTVTDGNDLLAWAVLCAAVCAFVAYGLWLFRLVTGDLLPDPTPRRNWGLAITAVAIAGAVGAIGGFATIDRGEELSARWVARELLDHGDDVAAELITGYRDVPNRRSTVEEMRIPAWIDFEVDGDDCRVVVDASVDLVDGDLVVLTPTCSALTPAAVVTLPPLAPDPG